VKLKYNLGDLVRVKLHPGTSLGVVVRGGLYGVKVLLNGRTKAGWISYEYLEILSKAR
jgi:hypothetical protein